MRSQKKSLPDLGDLVRTLGLSLHLLKLILVIKKLSYINLMLGTIDNIHFITQFL